MGSPEELVKQLEALSTPCELDFECSLVERDKKKEQDTVPSPAAKRHATTTHSLEYCREEEEEEEGRELYITFEWISGSERDLLNQVVQFLRNRMQHD